MTTTPALLGLATGLGVVASACLVAPLPRRSPTGARGAPRSSAGPLAAIGARTRRAPGLGASPLPDGWLGAVAVATVLALAVAPPVAALLPLAVWVHGHARAHRGRRLAERALSAALPDCVDLLLLCAGAGLSLPLAHPLVAARTPRPLGTALRAAHDAAGGGRARADALVEALDPLGEQAAALAHVLADHLRYGVPLAPGLERLALELRLARRRRAEEDARRVPVRLLAPLVTCVLPAFGLLTVVPLLVASLQGLPR